MGEFGFVIPLASDPVFITLRLDFLLMVNEGAMIFRIRFCMGLSDFDSALSEAPFAAEGYVSVLSGACTPAATTSPTS